MVKIRFIGIFLLVLTALNSHSQSISRSVIVVTGNASAENEGLLTYSVGEAVSGRVFDFLHELTQGFQQPSLVKKDDIITNLSINAVEVYPNPVMQELSVIYNFKTTKYLILELYSSNGTIIRNEHYSVTDLGKILLNMESLPYGFYILHAYTIDKVIDRIFKIEKM
ncbi:MAG: hypothetical protein H6540_07935 [Bacteroidales bacterium]|nr:hypothetical protein [Bacteroidales bacterium]